MEFSDFYDIAEYGNKHWKGAYSQKEVTPDTLKKSKATP